MGWSPASCSSGATNAIRYGRTVDCHFDVSGIPETWKFPEGEKCGAVSASASRVRCAGIKHEQRLFPANTRTNTDHGICPITSTAFRGHEHEHETRTRLLQDRCTMQHKLFDRGVFNLSDDLNVMVSESANGTRGFQEWVIAFHAKPIRPPQRPSYYPEDRVPSHGNVREIFKDRRAMKVLYKPKKPANSPLRSRRLEGEEDRWTFLGGSGNSSSQFDSLARTTGDWEDDSKKIAG